MTFPFADEIVGRGPVLHELQRWFEAAVAGRPLLLALTGDPGVGKTSLLRTAVGRWSTHADVHFLSGIEELDVELATVAPMLRSFRAPLTLDAGAMLTTLAEEVLKRAARRPVVVVADDFQWADARSRSVLDHLAARVRADATGNRLPVVVIFAARSSITRAEGLGVLDRIGRDQIGRVLRLDGLDDTGVAALATRITGRRPSVPEARELRERTGGNPLLVRLALESDGAFASVVSLDAALDERLAAVPVDQRRLLDVLAVHGEAISPALLHDLAGASTAGGPAPDAGGLARMANGRWELSHPQIRHLLLAALAGDERARIHHRLATVLSAGGAEPRVVEFHLRRAGSFADPDMRWRIGVDAAQGALARRDWPTAADAFRSLLPPPEDIADDPRVTPALLLAAAEAHAYDSQPIEALELCHAALALADRHGDDAASAAALTWAVRCRVSSATVIADLPELPRLQAVAQGAGDPLARSKAWVALADAAFAANDPVAARSCCERARAAARQSGDLGAIAEAEYAFGLHNLGRLELDRAHESFTRCGKLDPDRPGSPLGSWWRVRLALTTVVGESGPQERGRLIADATRLARDQGQWGDAAMIAAIATSAAVADGRFADADDHGEEALRHLQRSRYEPAAAVAFPALVCAAVLRADRERVDDLLGAWASTGWRVPRWVDAAARIEGDEPADALRAGMTEQSLTFGALTRACVVALHPAARRADLTVTVPALQAALGNGAVLAPSWCVSVARSLATAAARMNDLDGALDWLRVAGPIGAGRRLERAQLLLCETSILLRRGELDGRRTAAVHAAEALELASELGARRLATRARQVLDGVAPPETTELVDTGIRRTLLFTDLVDSTVLLHTLGDDRYTAVVARHHEAIRSAAEEHGGVVFTYAGDGFGLWFSEAEAAVRCAMSIHRRLAALEATFGLPLAARTGISSGTPINLDGNLFGVAVVRAARLCAAARGHQIVLDDATAMYLKSGHLVSLRVHGEMNLKGFPTPERVYVVEP